MKEYGITNKFLVIYSILSFISYIMFIYSKLNDSILTDDSGVYMGVNILFLTIIFFIIYIVLGIIVFIAGQSVENYIGHRRIMKKIRKNNDKG